MSSVGKVLCFVTTENNCITIVKHADVSIHFKAQLCTVLQA